MKRVWAPTRARHVRTARAVNSGPLSARRWAGTPGATMRRVRPWSTSAVWMCRATSMASPARVNSSSTVNRCSGRPSWVRGRQEVVGLYVAAMRRPQADAGPASEPESPPLRLAARHLEPFLTPDPLHPRGVHALARRTMAALRAASASGVAGRYLCVDRGWPKTCHARHAETASTRRAWGTARRRRVGLRCFPRPLPSGSSCRPSGRRSPAAPGRFRPQAVSAAGLGRLACPRIPSASGTTSVP